MDKNTSLVAQAYLLLLQTEGVTRINIQPSLCQLRDQLSSSRDIEDVQMCFETVANKLKGY